LAGMFIGSSFKRFFWLIVYTQEARGSKVSKSELSVFNLHL
jgi:hypothetical protein